MECTWFGGDGIARSESHSNGFAESRGANIGVQHPFGNDIDFMPKQILKVEAQATREPRAVIRAHLHEEIDIAPRACFVARDGAEDPDIRRAVLVGKREDCLALPLDILQSYRSFHPHRSSGA
jgi:hypothetical protein